MSNDVIKDGIMGFAVGDALGVPVEFINRERLRHFPVRDMLEYGTHHQPKGTWSDDTSMTVAAMDSIIEKEEIDYNDIMQKFLEWVQNSKYTATGDFFDIGNATRQAISNYARGVDPLNCGSTSERSNGNGSLMRILPFVFYAYYKGMDYDSEVELINNASRLTHGHDISMLGCRIYADFIKELLNGASKYDAYANLQNYDYSKYYSQNAIAYYKRVLSGKLMDIGVNGIKSSGFVVDSLEASIWSVLHSITYKDAVLKAVNLGEDTDTIGAITGSIAGILYGYDKIPKEWINNLQSKDYLLKMCDGLNNSLGICNNHTK